AMVGVRDGLRRLYIRQLNRADATEVGDTVGVNSVMFSPDGASLVFVPSSSSLTRLSLTDQQRAVVAQGTDLTAGLGWGSGRIVYTKGGTLWSVPTQGGESKQLTVLDTARREVLHTDPMLLPGGDTVLFSSLTTESGTERIEAVSGDGRKRWVVIEH